MSNKPSFLRRILTREPRSPVENLDTPQADVVSMRTAEGNTIAVTNMSSEAWLDDQLDTIAHNQHRKASISARHKSFERSYDEYLDVLAEERKRGSTSR